MKWWRLLDVGSLVFAGAFVVLAVPGLALAIDLVTPATPPVANLSSRGVQRLEANPEPAKQPSTPAPLASTGPETGTGLPIVYYHYTPANFAAQLQYLRDHGYTAVSLDEAVAGLHGQPLPGKPVVITFDDGFANQMEAVALLTQFGMKATFYIINAGERSHWCIGAGRRYDDPSQPAGGCGDAYLTWDQVREIDRNPLMTIGGHTLDHLNLAALSHDEAWHEIYDSKVQLEQQLGHAIRHFCYPYGAFTAETAAIARAAGYVSATTTEPGTQQAPGSDFTLHRVKDVWGLP